METSYLKLVSGSRLSNYLGLEMAEGYEFRYPTAQERNYSYIEVPVKELINSTTMESIGEGQKGLRNQHIYVVPACTVDVKGNYRFEVHPNPAFWNYGATQGMFYLEPRDGRQVPGFHVALRKDLDLSTLVSDWAIRIYMRV